MNLINFYIAWRNSMILLMGVLKEISVNFFVLWECVYYAKYSSGYILGNSLTGDKKIFRASQEVLAPVAWCCTEVLVPPLASLAIDPEPVILLATMQTRGPSS